MEPTELNKHILRLLDSIKTDLILYNSLHPNAEITLDELINALQSCKDKTANFKHI